ncbi:hypothetical protein BOTBODRAFT_26717 [Botryobasidium botryosum FD-172 SS1]|uniref:Uncharacterized protein n=1 Tax=Botryobasidium botryosum (strain FD-172 SS1) TaxID=930990 RepID=A0A067MYK7_BOTB1|nr:hypothetical protein BOTBODRAFT_26717 [Botryobasidium botryosum FD-172 SS1]
MQLKLWTCIPLLCAGFAAAAELRLHHRIISPDSPDSQFTLRGTIEVTPTGATLSSADKGLASLLEQSRTQNDAFYQLALEREGDVDQDSWAISPVKTCHLASSTSEIIRLHVGSSGAAFALDYFVSPVPRDGSCSSALSRVPSLGNTTVTLKYPTQPPRPKLRVPPPLTAEGQPLVPPPEKTFIQKYWIYGVIIFMFMVLSGAGPDEPEAAARPASN